MQLYSEYWVSYLHAAESTRSLSGYHIPWRGHFAVMTIRILCDHWEMSFANKNNKTLLKLPNQYIYIL